MMHGEDRYRGFIGDRGWIHSIRRQGEHKEVEAVLLPRIHRMMRGRTQQTGSDLPEFSRTLQRHQQSRIGAGRVFVDAEMVGELLVGFSRTGRNAFASTTGHWGNLLLRSITPAACS